MAIDTTSAPKGVDRESLPDHASEQDDRNLPINQVGIEDLSYPIEVLDKSRKVQHTVAQMSLSVGLPAEFKGTHMSRFLEVLNAVRGEMTVRNLPNILTQIQTRLDAEDAYLKAEFPYFISKKAPASGVESLMEYKCSFEASRKGTEFDFILGVKVPVTTLCPCSKAISEYGAHNQRSTVDVQVRATDFLWIEDVVTAVESCASAPLYALLKREDEKYVTEQAYDNPRFVEDLVREVVTTIRSLDGVTWIQTRASNEESIHNHAAFGELIWSSGSGGEGVASMPTAVEAEAGPDLSTDRAFGHWLRKHRQERNYGQSDLAQMLDLSASFLSRVEAGEKRMSRNHVARVAGFLGHCEKRTLLLAGYMPEGWRSLIADNLLGFEEWVGSQKGR